MFIPTIEVTNLNILKAFEWLSHICMAYFFCSSFCECYIMEFYTYCKLLMVLIQRRHFMYSEMLNIFCRNGKEFAQNQFRRNKGFII